MRACVRRFGSAHRIAGNPRPELGLPLDLRRPAEENESRNVRSHKSENSDVLGASEGGRLCPHVGEFPRGLPGRGRTVPG